MRRAIALGSVLVGIAGSASAGTAPLPDYPVNAICRARSEGASRQVCVISEQYAYDDLRQGSLMPDGTHFSWDEIPDEVRSTCIEKTSPIAASPAAHGTTPYVFLKACVINEYSAVLAKQAPIIPQFQR